MIIAIVMQIFLLHFQSVPAWSGTFYVSPTGNDSNPGTQAAPWKTWQKAADTMSAGDTTIVEDGTYTSGELNFNNSGAAGAPITLKARNQHLAILATTGCNMGISVSASYVIFENLRIVRAAGTSCSPITSGAVIRFWANTSPRAGGTQSTGWGSGIVRGLKIDGNSSFTISVKSNQDNTLIENNVLYQGVDLLNNSDSVVRNNVIYSGGGTSGNQAAGGGCTGGSHRAKYYGNTVYIDSPSDYGLIIGGVTNDSSMYDANDGYECYDCEIYQNVIKRMDGLPLWSNPFQLGMISAKNGKIYNNTVVGGPIFMDDRGSGACPYAVCPASFNPVWKNNIVDCQSSYATQSGHNWSFSGTLALDYNDFYACTSGVPSQAHPFSSNPLFVSRVNDWHLQSASPVIDKGVTMGLPYSGAAPDLGAYEFAGAALANVSPAKPRGLVLQ